MEDADCYSKPQRLVSETASQISPNQTTPSKFYSRFLYKAVLVTVFLVVLPLFPSRAPEFINQTILTRNWELLHLLFVGIAVSYGLFSRRNVETEKETHSKIDSAQNYVSRILQVSSVFDEEVETPSGSDENKIQTWNSQYFSGEPMVVVAKENSVLDEQSKTSTRTCTHSTNNKPLLLPVRSLRSQVSDPDVLESVNESKGLSGSVSRSSSGSKGSSSNSFSKTRKGEVGGLDPLDLEEKSKESVVLPSPIPWRSRSGRMEMKEEVIPGGIPPLYSLPPSAENSEFDGLESPSFCTPVSWSSRPSSTTSSPRKLSPSPSLSPELRGKNVEDIGRKKTFYKSPPPPPPPPPPPQHFNRKSPLVTAYSSPINKRSFEDELKDVSRTHTESSSMGNSVRSVRSSEPVRDMRKTSGDQMDDTGGNRSKDVEAVLVEKAGRKTGGYEEHTREDPCLAPKPTFAKYHQMEEEKEFFEEVIVESDSDSESDNDIPGGSGNEEASLNVVDDGGTDPNEVDKKADEFIAKFREQIRLQRIESIKRSSGQHTSRTSSR